MIKKSSGEKTESGIIFTGPCVYCGFTVLPGGTNKTIKIYDGVDDSGIVIESFIGDANKPTDGHNHGAVPVDCRNGIYLSMSGGTVVVFFSYGQLLYMYD